MATSAGLTPGFFLSAHPKNIFFGNVGAKPREMRLLHWVHFLCDLSRLSYLPLDSSFLSPIFWQLFSHFFQKTIILKKKTTPFPYISVFKAPRNTFCFRYATAFHTLNYKPINLAVVCGICRYQLRNPKLSLCHAHAPELVIILIWPLSEPQRGS